MKNFNRPLILASNSPRRKQLLKDLGFEYTSKVKPVEEDYPESLPVMEVAEYLANKKAQAYIDDLDGKEVLITSDTVVICDGFILGKPVDRPHAIEMLQQLSGKDHIVTSGLCVTDGKLTHSLTDVTTLTFKQLTEGEIEYYIDNYKPFDKAGAYGIQEWLGMVAVTNMEGSFYNVAGFPVHKVYETLMNNFVD